MPVISIAVKDDSDKTMEAAALLTRVALVAASEAGAPACVLDHLLDAVREFQAAGFDVAA